MNNNFDILIIDDESVIIDSIIKICKLNNLTSDSAETYEAAMQKIKGNKYNLVICDIMLPDKDGFEILKSIGSGGFDSPVIMITGYTTPEMAVKSIKLGAFDFLPKPFTIDELSAVIKRGMAFSKLNRKAVKNKNDLLYVPCPSKYYRFGYGSWIKPDLPVNMINEEFSYGSFVTGATDLFVKLIEGVQKIELLQINDKILQASAAAYITDSDGLIHSLSMPASCRIIDRNEKLLEKPGLIEKDPYFEGWFYKVIPVNMKDEIEYLIPCSSDR
ncbi:two component, sigma54 specific, Fis family transcriptional regulator [Melioribacter roseus P3M-2]|uniref:Two component, sigma54 specific, Fis family transcriptional regulator n=1 Tax=Melioribacter roseus (strain DSM 23840 / JCM 17771 / VKM B-2668 / P3M-2) TaxID=1191523 RepID=I6ZRW8_MELRP|nr:response regulator [Melioribacter roseus]AFN74804.1 two component, sigma54 specific, Fis family transcriptional regulator [Melioribacter roseus P3M-2]